MTSFQIWDGYKLRIEENISFEIFNNLLATKNQTDKSTK